MSTVMTKLWLLCCGMPRQWELEVLCSGNIVAITSLYYKMPMNIYRYAFVDTVSIYWSNQSTGIVNEGE